MKVAITGASSGIGRETALQCAESGYAVVLAARRENLLLDLAAECLAKGAPAAVPVPCDITNPADVERLALALGELPDDQIVLVNNAGTGEFGPAATLGPDVYERQIAINLLGPIRVTQAILPLLKPGDRIVSVLSIVAQLVLPGITAYGAAKAGQLHYLRALREEQRRKGIHITNILPGATDTPIWEGQSWKPNAEDMIPVEAVAETILWVLQQPTNRAVDDLTLLPPKGLL